MPELADGGTITACGTWSSPLSPGSAAGHRVFDQIVDVVESDLVDRLLHLERAWRRIFLDHHDRRFDRRTGLLDARDLLDDDWNVFGQDEVLPHPVSNLLQGVRRDLDIAAERVLVGGGIARAFGIEATREALRNLLPVELAADEHDPVDSLFGRGPGAAGPPLEIPMHALQQELIIVALEIEDGLHPKHPIAELADHRAEPGADLETVERARLLDADGVDVLQVIVMPVAMVMLVTMLMRVMKLSLLRELVREIDAADVEDLGKIDLRIPRPLNLRDLVEAADLLLGLVELLRRGQVDLVEHDQVGKGDLLAGLG